MDIEIASLSFTYPSSVTALRKVSLSIGTGEAVAIIGQNGAGKTTLVKHLNGLLKPTHGQVRVGSWDTRERSVAQLAARVGYVFQNPDDQLFQRTVRAEVMFGPRNLGWAKNRAAVQVETTLKEVGLLEQAGRHPYDLSPGDRRLVALAAVLAMDTPVIVLDEPTTGLDYAGVERIGRIVDDLRAKGRTLITITHDMDFCAEHFERVVVLAEGRLLLDGPSRSVFAQADVLAQSDVDPPQLARLASRLGLEIVPLTVEEFIAEVGQAGKTEL